MRGIFQQLPRERIELYAIFPGQVCCSFSFRLRPSSCSSCCGFYVVHVADSHHSLNAGLLQTRDDTSDFIANAADHFVRVPTELKAARDVC